MNQINHFKFRWLTLIALATVVATAVLLLNIARAQREPPLADLALNANDLKAAGITGLILRSSAPISPNDTSHPLNRRPDVSFVPALSEQQLEYQDVYRVEALAGADKSTAFVGNYLYRYAGPAQAQEVANAWTEAILQNPSAAPVNVEAQIRGNNLRGQAAVVTGSEGDAIYWFVAVEGRTLTLLMVNGLSSPPTQRVFEVLVERVVQH